MLLLPLGRSRCSLSCFWRNASLLLHAVSFFSPSAASQPAPLLVPTVSCFGGFQAISREPPKTQRGQWPSLPLPSWTAPGRGVAPGSSLAAG